jgi:hypothetical protein
VISWTFCRTYSLSADGGRRETRDGNFDARVTPALFSGPREARGCSERMLRHANKYVAGQRGVTDSVKQDASLILTAQGTT